MFEALERSIRYIFEELSIQRIMANYMPINTRSAKLLNFLGFTIEGYAKNYLLINGRWEDHILSALSLDQWLINTKNRETSLEKCITQAKYESLIFREVQVTDATFLVPLMEQLGYPIDPILMQKNVQNYIQLPNHNAWVAENQGK